MFGKVFMGICPRQISRFVGLWKKTECVYILKLISLWDFGNNMLSRTVVVVIGLTLTFLFCVHIPGRIKLSTDVFSLATHLTFQVEFTTQRHGAARFRKLFLLLGTVKKQFIVCLQEKQL